MIWKLFDFVPVVGPVIGKVGYVLTWPVSKLTCWISHQPDYVVNAVCVVLNGMPCQ